MGIQQDKQVINCVLLDNIGTQLIHRMAPFEKVRRDWLAIYRRHRKLFEDSRFNSYKALEPIGVIGRSASDSA